MWQRIQTVFLLIVIAAMVFTIYFPIWVLQAEPGNSNKLFALHYTVAKDGLITTQYLPYCLTAVFAVAAATIATISISKYNNRMLQRKLGALNSLLMAATFGCAYYFASQLMKTTGVVGQFSFGLYLPFVAAVSNFIANRFIMRDEKIVKDSDRLR